MALVHTFLIELVRLLDDFFVELLQQLDIAQILLVNSVPVELVLEEGHEQLSQAQQEFEHVHLQPLLLGRLAIRSFHAQRHVQIHVVRAVDV